MTNTTNFAIGDRVIIQWRGGGWDGVTGTVKTVNDEGDVWVDYDNPADVPHRFKGGTWTSKYGYVVKLFDETASTTTPNGVFASLTHQTSQVYAANATSRLLPEWANECLRVAAAGQEVDVVAFRKAATQALSMAATRAGQSLQRRKFTKEARHLIYWADAILDNHIAGLPVYEKGERSPKIAELRREIYDLTQAASDERRRLCAEIDSLKGEVDRAQRSESIEVERTTRLKEHANAEIDRLNEQIEDLLKGRSNDLAAMQDLYREVNEGHAALEYAFGLLRSEEDKSRLAGFRDGYAQRCIDVPTPEH